MTTQAYDFAIIGAGIAGASVASELAREASVLLLEMEPQPGYHTTGRSAAMFAPGYGPQPIRALTRASARFFNQPPKGFCEAPLLTQRDVVMIARPDQRAAFDAHCVALATDTAITVIEAADLQTRVPLLRKGYAERALLDTSGSDIDVHCLHHGFLRAFRKSGGSLVTRAEVCDLTRDNQIWRIATGADVYRAKTVINAAGAWAGQIGALAGAEAIGLVPKRRTALIIAPPPGLEIGDLPLCVDIDEAFYLKPDAGKLLVSPANEDPMAPCDVQPDEMDIALCIDRIERAFDLRVRRVENQWSGLRSFVADKCPVVGYSDRVDGFFWLAGQGGYGIQTAPALARLATALAQKRAIPADILAQRLDPDSIAPARLRALA